MNKKTKMRVGAGVLLAVGGVCWCAGYGPLAYEPTIWWSFAAQLLGGMISAFGFGLLTAGESVKRAVWYGVFASFAVAMMVGWKVMENENRARRVLSAFGVELAERTQEVGLSN